MLLLCYSGIDISKMISKYPNDMKEINIDYNNLDNTAMIHYIEDIKVSILQYKLVLVKYSQEIQLCLDALSIEYAIVCMNNISTDSIKNKNEFDRIKSLVSNHKNYMVDTVDDLEKILISEFSILNETTVVDDSMYDLNFGSAILVTENTPEIDEVETENTYTLNINNLPDSINDSKKITLQHVIDTDTNITEADVREIKTISNKFKVAMILQAQSRLKLVLKFLDILDKLYDELVDRIDKSLITADTASIMYTADYISKALNDTNQFIMSLISNEKIQNFFIIDNSNIINISDDRISIDKREKIRKAAEIVLENTEYFASGEYDKVVDPNNDGSDFSVSHST